MGRGRGRSIPGSVLPAGDQLIQDLFGPDYSVAMPNTANGRMPMLLDVVLGDVQLIGSERTERRELSQLTEWAAWVAAAALALEAVG